MNFLWIDKDYWECLYYLAFIVLTVCIAFFTAKTYLFQTKKSSKLFCKCTESQTGGVSGNVFFEIYNHGNDIAKNITIQIEGQLYGSIAFLKPNESYMLCFAFVLRSAEGLPNILTHDSQLEGDSIRVVLDVDGVMQPHDVDLSIVKIPRMHPSTGTRSAERIANSIERVANVLDNIEVM